jgi:hypothetical protein
MLYFNDYFAAKSKSLQSDGSASLQLWYLPSEVVRRPVVLRDDALKGDRGALLHPQVGRGEDLCPLLPPLLARAPARRRLRFLKRLSHEMDLAFEDRHSQF